jgi:hypothetical protein
MTGSDDRPKKLFSRQMRAYLVKDEATFERLALEKYQEDENEANQTIRLSSGGGPKGSQINSALNSYNCSSDESALGSTNSYRPRGLKTLVSSAQRKSEARNKSSDNRHSSATKIIDAIKANPCI